MPLYHVWFSTKRRKWLLEGDIEELAEKAIREVGAKDGIPVLECKAVIDHVHLLLDLPASSDLPAAMKALKGVFRAVPDLKLDAQINNLWQRHYGWKLVPPGAERTDRRYIRTQMDRLEKFEH